MDSARQSAGSVRPRSRAAGMYVWNYSLLLRHQQKLYYGKKESGRIVYPVQAGPNSAIINAITHTKTSSAAKINETVPIISNPEDSKDKQITSTKAQGDRSETTRVHGQIHPNNDMKRSVDAVTQYAKWRK